LENKTIRAENERSRRVNRKSILENITSFPENDRRLNVILRILGENDADLPEIIVIYESNAMRRGVLEGDSQV